MSSAGQRYTIFSTNPVSVPSDVRQKKLVSDDVGGKEVYALAAALIDVFLSYPRLNRDLQTKLLTQYFSDYPDYQKAILGSAVSGCMPQLINKLGLGNVLASMAGTLRRVAVNEIFEHPEFYLDVFNRIELDDLDKPSAPLDEEGIAALAKVLGIQIEVQSLERVKRLHQRDLYTNKILAKSLIIIQREKDYYTPLVAEKRFSSARVHPVRMLTLPSIPSAKNHSLTDILAIISAEEKPLVAEFGRAYHRLAGMVAAEELSTKDLLLIYRKSLNSRDSFPQCAVRVGMEHGAQRILDQMLKTHGGVQKRVSPDDTHDQELAYELAYGIAVGIVARHMDEKRVFALVENIREARAEQSLAMKP